MIGIILNITAIIIFGVLAARIALGIKRESSIFREFNQPLSLGFVVLLFPLGPIVYLAAIYRLGWLMAVVAAACCYLPSLLMSKRALVAFDRAGTDKVRGAMEVVNQAFGTALGGLVYSCIMLLLSLLAVPSSPGT